MGISAILFRLLGTVAGALLPKGKQVYAERAAAKDPHSVQVDHAEVLLDEALARLGAVDLDHPWWKRALAELGGAAVRPDWFKKPHVQEWLTQTATRGLLKVTARATLTGAPVHPDDYERLIVSYMDNSYEDRQQAESVISLAVAVLKASILAAVRDPGTAAIVHVTAMDQRELLLVLTSKVDSIGQSGALPKDAGNETAIEDRIEADAVAVWRSELKRTSQALLAWPTTLAQNQWIPRPEHDQLLNIIDASDFSTTALLGQPGSGKSALMAMLGKHLQDERGWPVFAIKADLLDSTVVTEADLQTRLDLPEKPSVIIQRLATHGPVVVLIDQLDALASYLDMHTGRLNALLNLVRRIGRTAKIHVVLSSRTFEFNHDVRLRTIEAQSLTLEAPKWSDVVMILESSGVLATGWPADAQEVMRSPQALNIYLKLKARGQSEPFSTYQGMLDSLWNERFLNSEAGSRQARLAYRIANLMAEEECLWLARARFDDQAEDVQGLLASGVLTTYGNESSVGFTHQTLFEYVLARSFALEAGKLSSYVIERQESLFVRPKLWAALNYLRTAEPTTYNVEFSAIWSTAGLRKHLRFLLIDFLGQQIAPTDREALLLEQALRDPDERALAFKALAGSSGWFLRFSDSFIAEAMADYGVMGDLMINVLISAWPTAPDLVTRLLCDRWASTEANDRRIWLVIQNAPVWSETTLALATNVIKRSEIAPLYIDSIVATLGVSQPQMALALVRVYLDSMLERANAKAGELKKTARPSFDSPTAELAWEMENRPNRPVKNLLENNHYWDSLPALAESAPFAFLDALWPWYLSAFGSLKKILDDEPNLGFPLLYSIDFKFEEETSSDLAPPAILSALVIAVEQAVKTDSAKFMSWASTAMIVELAPVQRLIAHGLAIKPAELAQPALDFLLADVRRFHLGWYQDLQSSTKRLVTACAPTWSITDVQRFEHSVLAYRPPMPALLNEPLQRRYWLRMIRRSKVELLRALPSRKRSAAAERHVEEETRVFPETHLDEDKGVIIGSIMQADQISNASDDDVVNAFRTLPDSTEWDHPKDWAKGGNVQLSRVFADFARMNPTRAARLMLLMEPRTGERAAGYALDALSEAAEPLLVTTLFLELCKRGFLSQEFKASAARAIERLIDRHEQIGDEVVETLESWLRGEPMPMDANHELGAETDTAAAENLESADPVRETLLWGNTGLSLVPGGDFPILETLIKSRFARKESDRIIEMLTSYLQRSKDIKIWESLLYSLVYLQPGDVDLRPPFIRKLFQEIPQLAGNKASAYLLSQVQWYAPKIVAAELTRWRASPARAARQGYGELTGLVAITQPELDWPREWLSEIISDKTLIDARAGAAHSAVNLWVETKHRAIATDLLIRLLASDEKGVWDAVFDLFRLVDELTAEEHTIALLNAIAKHVHSAPLLSETFVVERLGTMLPHEAEVVGRIAGSLVKMWRDQLADVSTSTALAAPQLIDLATTLHRLGPATRELGLNLFEQLVEIGAYQASQMLDEIDNRFRDSTTQARPTLRQRLRRSTRRRAKRTADLLSAVAS